MTAPLYDIPVRRIDGSETTLGQFRGKVLLVVNVASKCGLTPQYDGLEKLFTTYHGRGFEVLGFPCNQFMGQEPGTEKEIEEFCRLTYGVNFPMFAKIDVNGDARHPLYRELIAEEPSRIQSEISRQKGHDRNFSPDIRWNFEKFLVGRDGRVVARFDPAVVPEDPAIVGAIEKAL
ncbi:MAG: glutathione peroxidase [Rhizobiales bacterium]|nr:glutathione peroxidase [Hyphomicrobiales bacterium]